MARRKARRPLPYGSAGAGQGIVHGPSVVASPAYRAGKLAFLPGAPLSRSPGRPAPRMSRLPSCPARGRTSPVSAGGAVPKPPPAALSSGLYWRGTGPGPCRRSSGEAPARPGRPVRARRTGKRRCPVVRRRPGRPARGVQSGKRGPRNFFAKMLASQREIRYISFCAEVVELVDTLGSGSSSGNGVGVRVSPSAPMESKAGSNTSLFLFLGQIAVCCRAAPEDAALPRATCVHEVAAARHRGQTAGPVAPRPAAVPPVPAE